MMLDKEGDGDWVCIEPVVRVAGVELQFTFVIELALPIEVILFLHVMSQDTGCATRFVLDTSLIAKFPQK